MASLTKFKLSPFHHISFWACLALAISHLVGIIGLNSSKYHLIFERLSAINLLFSFLLVIVFQSTVNKNFILFCVFAFAIGMVAEVTGVNTGYPFGSYYYTGLLGPKLFGVPLVIGVNWILLSYCAGMAPIPFLPQPWLRILLGSILMVIIDMLLEPFAVRHHYWVWQSVNPPLQNYISWFLISVILQFNFARLIPGSFNINASVYLAILFIFLLVDLLFSYVW